MAHDDVEAYLAGLTARPTEPEAYCISKRDGL